MFLHRFIGDVALQVHNGEAAAFQRGCDPVRFKVVISLRKGMRALCRSCREAWGDRATAVARWLVYSRRERLAPDFAPLGRPLCVAYFTCRRRSGHSGLTQQRGPRDWPRGIVRRNGDNNCLGLGHGRRNLRFPS